MRAASSAFNVILIYSIASLWLPTIFSHKIPKEEEYFADTIRNAIEYAHKLFVHEENQKQHTYAKGIDVKNQRSSGGQFSLFASEDEETQKLEKWAFISLEASKKLERSSNISIHTIRHSKIWLRVWKSLIQEYCEKTVIKCDPYALYRTFNGSCNNLNHPKWGMTFAPQLRYLPPSYEDWIDLPRLKCHSGIPLPSPRKISNILFQGNKKPKRDSDRTVMVMAWGQFIDHDLIHTPVLMGANGSAISCCGEGANRTRPECFIIKIPKDDPHFINKDCMNFVRSSPSPSHSCLPAPREQINQVTSYIDASAVYGSTKKDADSLRLFKNGKLMTTKRGRLAPAGKSGSCVLEHPKEYCFKAGDKRVNVVPNLSGTHILFIKEHNRLAKKLKRINKHWTDEIIYQEARKIVSALLQHITYKEYLPRVLNSGYMSNYGLNFYPGLFNNVYRPNTNAGTRNSFGAAAFRFGHSQIPPTQSLLAPDYVNITHIPLEATFHKPFLVQKDKGENLPLLLRWLVFDQSTVTDRKFVKGVRDLLFLDKKGDSMDLPAVNIQRGRDHGMPCYNEWRQWCNLPMAKNFGTAKGGLINHTQEDAKLLQKAYPHVNDIDLYAGAISEIHIPYGDVGPTFACIIARQFHAYKYGDRFWYELNSKRTGFTRAQLKQIKKASLAKITCTNMKIDKIQKDVFTTIGPGNELTDCKTLPGMKLRAWRESIARTKLKHNMY